MQNKINTFLYIFKQSISNPNYYLEAANARFSLLFKYIFVFSLFSCILQNVYFVYLFNNISNKLPSIYSELKKSANEVYPDDLEITLKNGELSTNKPDPVFIKIPYSFINILETLDPYVNSNEDLRSTISQYNLAIIDTKAQIAEIEKYKTLALFTKNSYAYVSKNSSEKNIRYEFGMYEKSDKPVTLNKQIVNHNLSQVITELDNNVIPFFSKVINIFKYTLWVIFIIIGLPAILISHLFTSLLGLIIAKLLKVNLRYTQVYKMGMLLFPFFMVIGLLNNLILVPQANNLSILLYIIIISYTLYKSKNIEKLKP